MSSGPVGGRLEYAVVGGLNLYGLGRIDETCALAGKNLNGAFFNRHRFPTVQTPYRVLDLTTAEMGSSLSARVKVVVASVMQLGAEYADRRRTG